MRVPSIAHLLPDSGNISSLLIDPQKHYRQSALTMKSSSPDRNRSPLLVAVGVECQLRANRPGSKER